MTKHRLYRYVGRSDLIPEDGFFPERFELASIDDVLVWLSKNRGEIDIEGLIISTFIIDENKRLFVANRRCEHVACARVGKVYAAGEMAFVPEGKQTSIGRITNQSTGYCPEPTSWLVVEDVLVRLNMPFPKFFSPAFDFRKCIRCQQLCIRKEAQEDCLVCGAQLTPYWNIDE